MHSSEMPYIWTAELSGLQCGVHSSLSEGEGDHQAGVGDFTFHQ